MKFSGKIGYCTTTETAPGVWTNTEVEKNAVGEFIKNYHSFQNQNEANEDITLNSSISIIADPYAMANYNFIKYVKTIDNIAWKVKSIDVQYPRLILTLGGVYNAQ